MYISHDEMTGFAEAGVNTRVRDKIRQALPPATDHLHRTNNINPGVLLEQQVLPVPYTKARIILLDRLKIMSNRDC